MFYFRFEHHQTLSEKSFLLSCQQIHAAHALNEAMHTLWPDGVKSDYVFLIITGAAPRKKKAAGLSVSYT
jgi:hypothetical protein